MPRAIARFALVVLVVCAASPARAQAGVDVITTGGAESAVMSANGRYVAWLESYASDLFVKDRLTGTTRSFTSNLPPFQFMSELFALSDDGRYLAFRRGRCGHYCNSDRVLADLSTRTETILDAWDNFGNPSRPGPPGSSGVAMSRDGRTVSWYSGDYTTKGATDLAVMAITPASSTATRVGTTCSAQGETYVWLCWTTPAVSGDGRWILYTAGSSAPEALAYYDTTSGSHSYHAEVAPQRTSAWFEEGTIATTGDGRLAVTHVLTAGAPDVVIFDRESRRVDPAGPARPQHVPHAVSDDGTVALLARVSSAVPDAVLDRRSGLVITFPEQTVLAMSADGREVLGTTATDLRVTALDADGDGMLDGWERQFGLDPSTATDASSDPDGDGRTNLQEFGDRAHPTALPAATRLFAEGAAGSFFDTVVSVFNPGTATADVVVRLLGPVGTAGSQVVRLAPGDRSDIASCCIGLLEASEFGSIVESTQPIVADRRMSWDRISGYGSHASTGVGAAATEWYFAEGATIGGLQTFFLLQNAGAIDATATIEFLLAGGATVMRSYTVPAGTRQTVWVNQEGAPLAHAEFAAVVRSTSPVVVERAIYRDRPGQTFAAGTNAIGVTAPATTWRFAEGATGPFFDTFVLAANPGDATSRVTARFDLVTRAGQRETMTRTYDVAARSRLTIWLDTVDPLLADAEVVTTLDATVPIVAERAMWWAGDASTWSEGHVEFGATDAGTRFAVADAETADDTATDTFLLVGTADPGGALPRLRVTAYQANRAPITRDVSATAGRTTIWLRQTFPELFGHYSVVVESVAAPDAVPIVVERAVYSHSFAAGAAARATRLTP